jgi:hypothetical protein
MKAISHTGSKCEASIGRICLEYVETLTILDSPPGDVFRPAYFGTNKTMYPNTSFDDSILSGVATVKGAMSWTEARDAFLSVQPQHYVEEWNYRAGYHARINNQVERGYEGFYNETMSRALLKLTEVATGGDIALKEQAARGLTQLGIDLYAIHTEGGITNPPSGEIDHESASCGAWIAIGGFGSGRLAPILFASELLGQSWHTTLNNSMATLNGINCFGETGYIQREDATAIGKNVPLFGHHINNRGLIQYYAGGSCNVINNDMRTDGGYPGCGSPTSYQQCCTHGNWLGSAMAIWLTPAVYNNFPPNAAHWLGYVDRARATGVSVGADFGSYSNPNNFDVTGFDSNYDPEVHYNSWNAYAACSMRGTRDCAGMTFRP